MVSGAGDSKFGNSKSTFSETQERAEKMKLNTLEKDKDDSARHWEEKREKREREEDKQGKRSEEEAGRAEGKICKLGKLGSTGGKIRSQ